MAIRQPETHTHTNTIYGLNDAYAHTETITILLACGQNIVEETLISRSVTLYVPPSLNLRLTHFYDRRRCDHVMHNGGGINIGFDRRIFFILNYNINTVPDMVTNIPVRLLAPHSPFSIIYSLLYMDANSYG